MGWRVTIERFKQQSNHFTAVPDIVCRSDVVELWRLLVFPCFVLYVLACMCVVYTRECRGSKPNTRTCIHRVRIHQNTLMSVVHRNSPFPLPHFLCPSHHAECTSTTTATTAAGEARQKEKLETVYGSDPVRFMMPRYVKVFIIEHFFAFNVSESSDVRLFFSLCCAQIFSTTEPLCQGCQARRDRAVLCNG